MKKKKQHKQTQKILHKSSPKPFRLRVKQTERKKNQNQQRSVFVSAILIV